MAQYYITLKSKLLHELFTKDSRVQAFFKLLEKILNQVLKDQSTEQLVAVSYERSQSRRACHNGFRDRELTSVYFWKKVSMISWH